MSTRAPSLVAKCDNTDRYVLIAPYVVTKNINESSGIVEFGAKYKFMPQKGPGPSLNLLQIGA